MKAKIKWEDTTDNPANKDFVKMTPITIVRWEQNNMAIFIDKTRKEVEESFEVRLSKMEPIEFEINKGVFIGIEGYLNQDDEVYLEDPRAEMNLMVKKHMEGLFN